MLTWICPKKKNKISFGSLGLADNEIQMSNDIRKLL